VACIRVNVIAIRCREGVCVVEYVGGRIELSEMDRYLIEQLLEHLQHREG
jgi:hypothetical protein